MICIVYFLSGISLEYAFPTLNMNRSFLNSTVYRRVPYLYSAD